eukprot:CAMPEP_0178890842 /NCGR_PEP_ID=MMETSP0747-20121128/18573_1 /TAXON_ID=913974 /ORGANISM="Nitzschia punctata, Strain CCMP561" /LENGTH=917 /DNA_ID=CAMNT_0020560551 /DNA_START=126 /DNA_END=2880 /DNA_ORIENTATION=+
MMETISPSTSSGSIDGPIPSSSVATTGAPEDNRIDVPMENDVLCGRGGSINSHKGNEQFRELVEKRKRVYLTARFKREKRLIASSIVSEIRGMNPPGRFLARKGTKDTGFWYDIGDEKARDKTSQALRENAPSIRAEIETEITKQREEMRRQEEGAPSNHPSQKAPPPFPPPPPHPPGAAAVNTNTRIYAQQYYDYYYHYYGYGAPPPPPPPGYPGGGPPPPGFPHAPPPYWAAPHLHQQQQQNSNAPAPATGPSEGGNPSPNASASVAAMPPAQEPQQQMPGAPNQEEEDHRIAMALQQEENARAFEDRNRRVGSDRKSSRSTAFCAPGYRPRLLNDNALDEFGASAQTRKRPAMSASHFVSNTGNGCRNHRSDKMPGMVTNVAAAPATSQQPKQNEGPLSQEEQDRRMALALQEEEDKIMRKQLAATGYKAQRTSRSNVHSQVQRANHSNHSFGLDSMVSSSLMAWTRGGNSSNNDVNNNDRQANVNMKQADVPNVMDQKPAANNNLFDKPHDDIDHHHHHHDHSLSSFGRSVHFKDDSDMISLFGEGSTILPPPNSTGGSHRVRDASLNLTPIALDDSQNSRLSQFQQKDGSRQFNTPQRLRRSQEPQDPSLLSQVANHFLGTFGSSWAESDIGTPGRSSIIHQRNNRKHQHQNPSMMANGIGNDHQSTEMDAEMGQEVVMDMRDEASSMPPPEPRGPGVQLDWPSRAGCHSWIPETIGANASAFFGNNHDEHDNLAHDHSLTRHTSYSHGDISPVNSLDIDMSHSSHMGVRRRNAASSLMNVFDQKNDPAAVDLHPHNHQSAIHQVPSWDRSFRSRSPTISLGDLCAEEEDDSLIRVNSYDVKDKFLGGSQPGASDVHHQHLQNHLATQMPPPAPIHRNHFHHSEPVTPQDRHVLDDSDDMDMGMDWEDHAGE